MPQAAQVGPALAVLVAQSRAWVTVQSGRFAEGLRLFDASADMYRAAGLPLAEHYIEYADALMELRLLPEAAGAARLAVAEFTAAGVPLMAAEAQLRVAQLALLTGDAAEATVTSTAAAAEFARQTRSAWRARALLVLAEARLRSGTATLAKPGRGSRGGPAPGRPGHDVRSSPGSPGHRPAWPPRLTGPGRPSPRWPAMASLARGTPVLVRLRGRVSSALAAGLADDDRAALAHCRRGLADLARHRSGLGSVELRALASGHGAELGRIGLDVVIRDGSPARVLNWMERSRAAALLAVEPPEFAGISADLTALRAVQAGRRDDDPRAGSEATARAGQAAIEQAIIEDRIRQATWRASSRPGMSSAPVTAGELRDRLAGRCLIAYGLLGQDLVAVVIQAAPQQGLPPWGG